MKKGAMIVILGLILCVMLARGGSLHASQYGMGHYSPGALASFIDGAPTGLAVLNIFNYYNGSAGGTKTLPIGIQLASDVDATIYSDSLVLGYGTPFGILGGKFAVAAVLPYVWCDVSANLSGPLGTRTKHDRAEGLGDMMFIPFWLSWNKGDFKWDVQLNMYAPTGEYDRKALANVGLNYWTFSPALYFSYLSKKIGLELTAFAGLSFNTKNEDADYQSGDIFHIDLTVAEHLPLFDYGVIGLGFNAFYWKQFTGDSGSGALLGSFESRTQGVGPVLSYVSPPFHGQTILAEVKWLPELDVKNRLSGDYVWFKLVWAF
jgi:hypothetical protein